MEDSSSFSSLLALVDDHLSKTHIKSSDNSLQAGDKTSPVFKMASLQNCTQSESCLPSSPRVTIPAFGSNQNSIQNVLAEQIANMLKAKEKKQDGKENIKSELDQDTADHIEDSNDGVIDLMKALSVPFESSLPIKKDVSKSNSSDSLFHPQLIDCDFEEYKKDNVTVAHTLLSCSTDMSYILKKKLPKAKCSTFGKVLISRHATAAMPYFREKCKSNIKRFDFKSKSPCDLIKERLRKTGYNTNPTEFSVRLN